MAKKYSPQDLLRQLTRAPGFVRVPDVPVETNLGPSKVESRQESDLLNNADQSGKNNVQIQQEQMDIETQLQDKMDDSDDGIPNYFDQITETMEFTGEVITDRDKMGIEFNDQVQIQPPDEIFNRFRRNQGFDDNADNNEIVDAFNSPLAGSSRLQEGNEFDNFWLGRNSYELNNLIFDNFNGIRINENSEQRTRLLNELLRSSLGNQVEYDSNYTSHEEKHSRVQSLFNNSKKYEIENIISLNPLIDETMGNSIHDEVNDFENEATTEVKLVDKSYHQPESDTEMMQGESEEILQEKSINELALDHLDMERDIQKNRRARAVKPTGITHLPNSLVKSLFNKFLNIKMSKEAMQAVFDGTQEYFEQISNDLNTYASHAKRAIIQEKDVLLLMKRQGLITEKITFESLVEQYLPRELSDEICPYALAGNTVYPQK